MNDVNTLKDIDDVQDVQDVELKVAPAAGNAALIGFAVLAAVFAFVVWRRR